MTIRKANWTPKQHRNVVAVQDKNEDNEIVDIYSNRENVWLLVTLRGKPYQPVGNKPAGKLIGSYSTFTRLLKSGPLQCNVCLPGEVLNQYVITLKQLK